MNHKRCKQELELFGYQVNTWLEVRIESGLDRLIRFMNRVFGF